VAYPQAGSTQSLRHTSTPADQHTNTAAQQHTSTPAHKHTAAHQHTSTPALLQSSACSHDDMQDDSPPPAPASPTSHRSPQAGFCLWMTGIHSNSCQAPKQGKHCRGCMLRYQQAHLFAAVRLPAAESNSVVLLGCCTRAQFFGWSSLGHLQAGTGCRGWGGRWCKRHLDSN
jgi:hypothetical protein